MMTLWGKDKPVKEMVKKTTPMDHQQVSYAVEMVEQAKVKGQPLHAFLHQHEDGE